ncbi:MAG: TolC family protein [Phycisphaerales bacterium]
MNKRAAYLLVVLGWGLLAAGCTSVPAKGGFDHVERNARQRIAKRVHWNQGGSEDQAVAEAVESLLQRPLGVDDAVQVALLNNRRLQASYEELGVTQASLVQAGLLKNPRFSGSYLPAVESGPVPVIGLELAQNFADLFFIAMRQRIASSEFDASKARVTSAVLEMAGRTRAAFLEYQAAEQLLEMRGMVADAAAASFDAGRKLFEAGNITQLALAGERASHTQAKLDLASAQAAVLSQRERLTRLMGLWGTDATVWRVAERLPELPRDEIDLQHMERRAIAQSLDLAEARAKVEQAAGRAGLTQWSTVLSDIEIGVAGDREDDGAWHVGPSVSLQIPIFDQGQARNAAAAAELRRALQEYAAEAVELRSAARAARDRLVAARERAAYCREALLPARHEVLRESQLQYNAMQIGVFQLLTARRDEIEAGRQYIESLRDYWMARANLELILAGRNTTESGGWGLGAGGWGSLATRYSLLATSQRKDH